MNNAKTTIIVLSLIIVFLLAYIAVRFFHISIHFGDDAIIKKEAVQTQKTEKDISSFIPDGWQKLHSSQGGTAEVVGDLNGDDLPDIAFVSESSRTGKTAPLRTLIIATKNSDGSYTQAVKADNAILREDEGGVDGDPFVGLEIKNGVLTISYMGGSAWTWSGLYRFKYQKDGWYLIEVTKESFSSTMREYGGEYENFNLLTGAYKKRETRDTGVEKNINMNRGIKPLVNLVNFDIHGDDQF